MNSNKSREQRVGMPGQLDDEATASLNVWHSQTTDILDSLRDPRHSGHLNQAAADEIERLRKELKETREELWDYKEGVLQP